MNIHVVNQFIPEEHDLNNKKILIIGSRASGKSFLIKDLLFNIPHISSCNHYSFQKDYNSYYGNFINNYLYNNENNNSFRYGAKVSIFDDFYYNISLDNNKTILHGCNINDPHLSILYNYIFLTKTNKRLLSEIYHYYGLYNFDNELTYETFEDICNTYTKNYSTFVIKFYANKPQFYHYTAKEHEGFVGYGMIYRNILEQIKWHPLTYRQREESMKMFETYPK